MDQNILKAREVTDIARLDLPSVEADQELGLTQVDLRLAPPVGDTRRVDLDKDAFAELLDSGQP